MRPDATSHRQQFWDARAACNFIGGGTGAGLLVCAAAGAMAGAPYFLPGLAGLAFVMMGLMMVWAEIGQPWRAFNVLFRPQTSWMSRESIVAILLFAIGAVALGSAWPGVHLSWLPSSPVAPALLTAFTGLGFLFCQLRMLYAVRGVPAWRQRTLLPLVGLSGLAEGAGLYLIFTVLWGRELQGMLLIVLGLIVARALAWQVYLQALHQDDVPMPTVAAFQRIRGSVLLLGHGLPGVLIALAFLWQEQAGLLAATAGGAVTLAGWLFKLVLITRAAYTRAASLPALPVRGQAVTPAATPS